MQNNREKIVLRIRIPARNMPHRPKSGTFRPAAMHVPLKKETMKKYKCTVCNWVYDPAIGDPDHGIAPGTPFEELPDDWTCPECGVGKEMFEPEE